MTYQERGVVIQNKNLLQKLSDPPWKFRIPEITLGLALAHFGDVPVAALGVAVFLHGLAGPEIYIAIKAKDNNASFPGRN